MPRKFFTNLMVGGDRLVFGSAGDTSLYRSAANRLKTDGDLTVANNRVVGVENTAGSLAGFSVDAANAMILGSALGGGFGALVLRGGNSIAFQVGAATNLMDLSAAGVLRFGVVADTDLLRRSAGVLGTSGDFAVANTRTVGALNQTGSALAGFSVDATNRMLLGSTAAASFTLLTLRGATAITFEVGAATQLLSIDSAGKLLFGSAADTNLYRVAAGTLKTDGSFQAATSLSAVGGAVRAGVEVVARDGGVAQVAMGSVGNFAGLYFGPATDTSLYRPSAGVLKTDGQLQTASVIYVNISAASQVSVGFRDGSTVGAGILFGNALDADLPPQGPREVSITDLLVKIGSLTVELDMARGENAQLREHLEAQPDAPPEKKRP